MRGVSKIEFWDNGDDRITGTTDLASADWAVSADGRSITISKATIEAKGANWHAADTDRQLQLTTVGGMPALTPQIATGNSIFSNIAGITGSHYKRDADTLVINGTNLAGATFISLVDESGDSIAGVDPRRTPGQASIHPRRPTDSYGWSGPDPLPQSAPSLYGPSRTPPPRPSSTPP